ncbi:MAG: PilC/PilY family type IV pilus protein [Woeseiaceae bacterium]|nr:PilC/PilY family type IV pilus protein [Woeseiaceae bacterium]
MLRIIEEKIMKIAIKRTTWMTAGACVALLSGVHAIADDTELLLINPDPTQNPKPNVLFILDTSGSMTTTETTIDPYDSTETYTGACDPDRVYWTDVDIVPVCDVSNTSYIEKSSFHCQYAANQMSGIGSFTNTMVQYRDGGKDGTSTGPTRWQYLAPGYNTAPVECQADSGVHGDGRATHLWAANGTNLADPFTDNASSELSWGSAPRNLGYTFYDGNYLNWKSSPENVTLSRSNIMKEVTKKVLGSVNNLNVGLMRFNEKQGGPVTLGITDLDTNRQAVIDAIDALPADGWTPLSETMYEAALYWRGEAAHFGELISENPTDPAALESTSPEVYKAPTWDVCAKNYNVLLTDGLPTEDADGPTLIPTLPGYAAAMGRTDCTGTGQGHCLDDVAEYMSTFDLDPNELNDQLVTTHTIGFTIDLDILRDTAQNSGGEYFLADDVESLTKTLLDIIANINDRSLAFSAPAVSVNTFNRTQNLNDLYITMFGARGKTHWPGNLKKYRIDDGVIVDSAGDPAVDPATGFFSGSAQSFWTTGTDGNDVRLGGAANRLPDPADRKLYTNINGDDLTLAANAISTGNASSFLDSDLGLTGASGEPTKDELIRWARGEDIRDENSTSDVRYAMGDPLHSQPAAVVYGGTADSPDLVVYMATNDGYLHAIDGATGQELWSFIPKELLPNLTRLFFDPNAKYKQYGIDGNLVPVMKDVDNDGKIEPLDGDFVYLVFGMRRGGNDFYALDITDKTAPEMLWQANLPEFGESWSTPVVAKVDISGVSQNADNAVIIVGGGYDTAHDTTAHPIAPDGAGAGVFMLDLESGAQLWRAGSDISANLSVSRMTRAIATQIKVTDLTGNGFADRMYASDMGGQVWRFDIHNGSTVGNLATGGVIAQLGAEGTGDTSPAATRRFYNSPDIAIFIDNQQQRRFMAVNIGSGYRAHPFDLSAADRFFSLRDPNVFAKLSQDDYDDYPIITDGDLVEVAGSKGAVISSSDRGWKLTLPANQKILADSITFDDTVFFVAFTPDSVQAQTCAAGKGTNFLYRVTITNGDPIVPDLDQLADDDADAARQQVLRQGGIAPSPRILFPSPEADCTGDDCKQPPIGCIGVECFDPGFVNNPVRTLWTQDGIE